MPIAQVALPPYTKKMELWNAITHGMGVLFALIAGPFAIVKISKTGDPLSIVAVSLYVASMFVLYLGSALYHGSAPSNAKRFLRVMDHSNIFLLVSGSYLPYCWIALRNPQDGFPWGWVISGLVIGLSILGTVLNFIDIHKFRYLNLILYIALGSVIVVAFYPLYFSIGFGGCLTLFLSGVFYWIGAALFAIAGKKNLWLHTVFHVFILLGTAMMYFSIYFFVL